MLLVEFNEFDPCYLGEAARRLNLKHLQRMLSYPHSATATDDRVEHHGLDPWVQWVGVHCGKPTEMHGILRLGATRAQKLPQIWHEAANLGRTWGVWGAMNAPLGDRRGCRFFMPDPWAFEEMAYPPALDDLLALPRYVARNYLDVDRKRLVAGALRFMRFFAPPRHWGLFLGFAARAARGGISNGFSVHMFATLLDYLSVLCFIKLRRESRPDLSIIFLNNIAHLQHQFWSGGDRLHPEMRFGLELSDAMFGLLLSDRGADEAFAVMNGLKQKNVKGQGFYVYRQRRPQAIVEELGIRGACVEQNMTHDATLVFSDSANADRAFDLLERCVLSDGHKAFYVERQASNRIFYQLAFEHHVSPDISVVSGNFVRPFYDLFQLVCERTGAHVPEGDIYHDAIDIPEQIKNHQMFDCLLRHLREHTSGPAEAAATP